MFDTARVGVRNYLVEGVSTSGKTTVATELERRGHHVVHGDRVLAYQGDPVTGEPLPGFHHEHHVWDVDRVRALVADRSEPVTFFCGGSRNHAAFVDLLDERLPPRGRPRHAPRAARPTSCGRVRCAAGGARAGAARARDPRGPPGHGHRRSTPTGRWPRSSTRSCGWRAFRRARSSGRTRRAAPRAGSRRHAIPGRAHRALSLLTPRQCGARGGAPPSVRSPCTRRR